MQKEGSKKRRLRAAPEPIADSTRIHIRQALQHFAQSNDDVYKFEANLSNADRAEVHALCRKMRMKSRSSGSKKGTDRRVSVFKTKEFKRLKAGKSDNTTSKTTKGKKSKPRKENLNLTSFTFSEEGKTVLNDYFSHYPPGENGEAEKSAISLRKNACNDRSYMDDILSKPKMQKAEVENKFKSAVARMESRKLKKITEARSKLPIASFKDAITSTIAKNQVVLISGETGCGKTTQVPQYLLDYMWSRGEACKIVCTQPRRISAISVAERIAAERGESIGDSIGYKIRMERKGGRHSSVVFCTNGILLRVLVRAGHNRSGRKASTEKVTDTFPKITHIIVDEIHERDRFSDFMLTIIRDMLPFYPNLRVILMSATLDAGHFSEYFGGCPIIRVPGFTYNVQRFYLEDVLKLLKSKSINVHEIDNVKISDDYRLALDEAINLAWSNDEMDSLLDFVSTGVGLAVLNYQHSVSGVTPLMVFARKGSVGDMCMLLSFGANCHLKDNEGKTALAWAEHENQKDASEILRGHSNTTVADPKEEEKLLDKYLENVNPEIIDVILIEQLVRKICTESEEGAILVFFAGWDDITRVHDKLSSSNMFKDSSKFLILPLHSMVPAIEQRKVFIRPPHGCRKIILSTNIAETAVTIDDVVFVIDSGRVKEKSYDPYDKVSTLQSSWISKASLKQREGRAGRCQPGICYHLFSKLRADSLPEFQEPEIKRTPIEELCLQVKLLDPSRKIEDFLNKTLDPPVSEAIHNAISILQDIGALSPDEELTELGEKLGSIPVNPVTSKMLLFAISMDCLDPALTLACANEYRDPFVLPMLPGDQRKARLAKCELGSLYGSHGDQLAVIAAYELWMEAKQRGNVSRFYSRYFVSGGIMNMLSGMRKQLQNELCNHGFIPENSSRLNDNVKDLGVIHAVLVAGLYPKVGRLHTSKKPSKPVFIENAYNDKVRLHPQSVVSSKVSYKKKTDPLLHKRNTDQLLVIYDEITRSDSGMNIKNCCIIGPLPLLLLATEIAVAPIDAGSEDDNEDDDDETDYEASDEEGNENKDRIMSSPENEVKVIADRWLSFKSTALDVAQIYCLRERVSAAIMFKISHPGKPLPELLAASIHAAANVLSYDGLKGINRPLESVDSLTSMIKETGIGQSGNGVENEPALLANGSQQNFQNHGPLTGRDKHYDQHPSTSSPQNKHHNQGSQENGNNSSVGDSHKRHRRNRA